jgi:putative Ca2+/H+ antiporter (TMEM165/GDT1 family)
MVGITIATAVVHAVSVAVGYGLGATLPTGWIALIAAVAFVGFGAWTLRGDSLSDGEHGKAEKSNRSAILAASAAFFLAELGDKTMLATITLATQHGWFGVWLGSTLGMVAADGLAIVVGRQLGRHLPERAIAVGASALFFAFGAWLLVDALHQLTGRSAWDNIAVALNQDAAGWIALGLGVLALLFVAAQKQAGGAESWSRVSAIGSVDLPTEGVPGAGHGPGRGRLGNDGREPHGDPQRHGAVGPRSGRGAGDRRTPSEREAGSGVRLARAVAGHQRPRRGGRRV